MNSILTRIGVAWSVVFSSRVLLIERKFCKKRNKDKITLWGTLDDKVEQVKILSRMADSIYADLSPEDKKKCSTL